MNFPCSESKGVDQYRLGMLLVLLLLWFFLLYVLVFKIFVLLAPYVCFHIFN